MDWYRVCKRLFTGWSCRYSRRNSIDFRRKSDDAGQENEAEAGRAGAVPSKFQFFCYHLHASVRLAQGDIPRMTARTKNAT
jgi:hypothetical protein